MNQFNFSKKKKTLLLNILPDTFLNNIKEWNIDSIMLLQYCNNIGLPIRYIDIKVKYPYIQIILHFKVDTYLDHLPRELIGVIQSYLPYTEDNKLKIFTDFSSIRTIIFLPTPQLNLTPTYLCIMTNKNPEIQVGNAILHRLRIMDYSTAFIRDIN